MGAAGWCYQCDSRNPGCQVDLDEVVMAYNKVPCNGQCYVCVKDNCMSFKNSVSVILLFFLNDFVVMYRGCSWEYGFTEPQVSLTPMFEQETIWVFCDTPL